MVSGSKYRIQAAFKIVGVVNQKFHVAEMPFHFSIFYVSYFQVRKT